MTEDVAEVIAKDIKQAEGHGATSEVPMPFLASLYRLPLVPNPIRKKHVWLVVTAIAVVLLAILWFSQLLSA